MKIILSLAEDEFSILHDACKLETVSYRAKDGTIKERQKDIYYVNTPHDLEWLLYTLKYTYDTPLGINIFECPLNPGYFQGEF